jgi:hypothetical protein
MGAVVIHVTTPPQASLKFPCVIYFLSDCVVFMTFTLLLLAIVYNLEVGASVVGLSMVMAMNMLIGTILLIVIVTNATMIQNEDATESRIEVV